MHRLATAAGLASFIVLTGPAAAQTWYVRVAHLLVEFAKENKKDIAFDFAIKWLEGQQESAHPDARTLAKLKIYLCSHKEALSGDDKDLASLLCQQPETADMVFWKSIMLSKNQNDFHAYINKFGHNGQFISLARNRLKELQGERSLGATATPTPNRFADHRATSSSDGVSMPYRPSPAPTVLARRRVTPSKAVPQPAPMPPSTEAMMPLPSQRCTTSLGTIYCGQ